jgi:thiamine biosynthesis lipoprotein
MYRQLYEVSDGLVTPLIGQVLSDAGYDADYSLKPGTISMPLAWDDVLQLDDTTLTTSRPVLLDFGAAGKGYLVDIISELLQQQSIQRFCVDAGGDMRCSRLAQPLRIGLEHPDDPSQAIGIATISSGAICGSAGNRRAWGSYHHIMNPHTLQPVNQIKATWVTAQDTLTADGLATALFFVPAERLQQHFSFAHCVVYSDNTVQCSADFPAEIFS